jgi:hypothetical protein
LSIDIGGENDMADPFNPKTTGLVLSDEMLALIQRGEKGDTSVLPQLRTLLHDTPELWQRYGDLAKWAEQAWLRLACGPNLTLKESLELKLLALKDELGPSTSPLESLLVQRVVISWLEINYADAYVAQLKEQNAASELMKVGQRLQDRAHGRHLAAIRALAQLRKFLKPALSPLDLAALPLPQTVSKRVVQRRNGSLAALSSGSVHDN